MPFSIILLFPKTIILSAFLTVDNLCAITIVVLFFDIIFNAFCNNNSVSLSTVRNADNIIVIGDGNIIESGNHDVLISLRGVYEHLWNIQTGKIDK